MQKFLLSYFYQLFCLELGANFNVLQFLNVLHTSNPHIAEVVKFHCHYICACLLFDAAFLQENVICNAALSPLASNKDYKRLVGKDD